MDLDALEKLARKATPGPWAFTDYEGSTHVWANPAMSSMVADSHTDGAVARVRGVGAGLPIPENAAHIAACDPTTILALITRLRAAEARTAPVAVQLFQDQIDADRVALAWTADVPAESMPDRSTWRLEQGLGRVTATWSTRDGRRALTRLAVIVRDDFNHSVLVTVNTGPERAEARTAWQPIETADEGPFDEPQLVCLPSGRRVVALYDGRRWWNEDGSPIATPTARMPLPAAPEAS